MQLQTPHDIGNLIKANRLAQHLSQSDLAKRVGVSRLWIVQTERGNPGASLALVLRTLSVLGVTLATPETVEELAEPVPVGAPDLAAVLDAARRW